MNETFDIIVVGNGLIGSAAARYLGTESLSVLLLGAPEPKNWSGHRGVFASHYDEGRITRIIDQNPIWSELARRSIAEYHEIQLSSGITFFHPVGCLQGGSKGRMSGKSWEDLNRVAKANKLNPMILEGTEIQARYFFFEARMGEAMLETVTAGHINPRALVRAQNKLAVNMGVKIIEDSVLGVFKKGNSWLVETKSKRSFSAGKVLIAAGAFTNGILRDPIPISIFPRTVLFSKVTKEMKENLKDMPCIIWDLEPGYDFSDIYLMPPILYPDGQDYIKIGGDSPDSYTVHTQQELKEWFRKGGSSQHTEGLRRVLFNLMPILVNSKLHYKPCVTTYTYSGYPLIDELEHSGLYVACAGCGLSAKSSNELGRLAAMRTLEKTNKEEPEGSMVDWRIFSLTATPKTSETLN